MSSVKSRVGKAEGAIICREYNIYPYTELHFLHVTSPIVVPERPNEMLARERVLARVCWQYRYKLAPFGGSLPACSFLFLLHYCYFIRFAQTTSTKNSRSTPSIFCFLIYCVLGVIICFQLKILYYIV